MREENRTGPAAFAALRLLNRPYSSSLVTQINRVDAGRHLPKGVR